jgi:hypothetical protein
MVNIFISIAVYLEFNLWVKPKTIKLVFVASLQST